MSNKPIGWEMWETQEVKVSAYIIVMDIILTNKNAKTVNADNIGELIQLCLSYMPNDADHQHIILNAVEKSFPQFKDQIDKYRILV
jgi:hypothetical protein